MKRLIVALLFFASSLIANAGWLPLEIHEVRAYVYDYTQEKGNVSLLKLARLHKGVINTGGAKLSEEQIERLKNALRSSKKRIPGAFCYFPHHGFVFYDKERKAMGHIELCFQCGNVDSSPRGLPESEWDWKVIKKLLEELELPILKKDEDYTKLYTEKRASSEGGAESAAAPASKSKSEGKPEPESEGRSQ